MPVSARAPHATCRDDVRFISDVTQCECTRHPMPCRRLRHCVRANTSCIPNTDDVIRPCGAAAGGGGRRRTTMAPRGRGRGRGAAATARAPAATAPQGRSAAGNAASAKATAAEPPAASPPPAAKRLRGAAKAAPTDYEALTAETVLEWLLPGHTAAEFREAIWERKPLLVQPEQPARFAGLVSLAEIREMLKADPHFAQNVMVCRVAGRDGRRDEKTPENASAAALWKLYNQGYTLQVFQPQQHSPRVAGLCRALEVRPRGMRAAGTLSPRKRNRPVDRVGKRRSAGAVWVPGRQQQLPDPAARAGPAAAPRRRGRVCAPAGGHQGVAPPRARAVAAARAQRGTVARRGVPRCLCRVANESTRSQPGSGPARACRTWTQRA